MIQYYLDLEMQVKKIRELNSGYAVVQKIYSTAYFICISLRFPGRTRFLYLGRGNGFEGIWLGDKIPDSVLRRRDNFLEYFRRHLSGSPLLELNLDPHDRIIQIGYQKFGKRHSLYLFWKARKLYFAHHFQETPEAPFKVMLSWKGKPIVVGEDEAIFPLFDEVGRTQEMSHDRKSPTILDIDQQLEEERKLVEGKGVFRPDFLKRKKTNIEDDLRRAQQWRKLQDLLDRGDDLDNTYELKVGDQKIKFESGLNPFERRDLVFQKIKKLKRGEKILTDRLSEVEQKLLGQKEKSEVQSAIPMNRPVWGIEKAEALRPGKQEEVHQYKIFDFETYFAGVGLSAQGNDQLRSKWATKEDLWFHLDGHKSSHVIVKFKQLPTLTTEVINTAATILASFSQFSGDWIPIIYTQVKNLKGVTGVPGKVIFKKEKHIRCPKVSLPVLD